MKKLFLVPTILGFAAIALACQADARPGGCARLGVDCRGNCWPLCRPWRHGGRRRLRLWNTQAEQL